MSRSAARFVVEGRVQGVGFRWWAREQARALGLAGWVRNLRGGAVELLAIGEAGALAQLEAALHSGPAAAEVRAVARGVAEDDGSQGFSERPTL